MRGDKSGDRHRDRPADRGVSLIEVIVATGILTVAMVSLAQLLATAVDSNLAARTTMDATVLAQQKVEELLTSVPAGASMDYIDRFGSSLGGGAQPPPDAIYTRRWTIDPLRDAPGIYAIVVRVTSTASSRVDRRAGEVRLVTVAAPGGPL